MGQQSAAAESSGSKVHSHDDPYITQRGIYYRLHKQILEENNNRQDLISVQENFAAFEHHVVEVIQQAMASFVQHVGGQVQRNQNAYTDMLSNVQRIPPDFEWNGFKQREAETLVDPASAPRSIEGVTFPNQNHKSTQPLLEGTLERKSRNILSSGYSTGYYAITNALYLHGFKDNDNVRKDPEPEISIYLPDAVIGVPNGEKFHVKGKDVSKGFSSKLAGTSELNFKAHTANDAEKWVEVIKMAAGANAARAPYSSGSSSPISPTTQKQASFGSIGASAPAAEKKAVEAAQEDGVTAAHPTPLKIKEGVTGEKVVASPTAVAPSATGAVVGTDKATAKPPFE